MLTQQKSHLYMLTVTPGDSLIRILIQVLLDVPKISKHFTSWSRIHLNEKYFCTQQFCLGSNPNLIKVNNNVSIDFLGLWLKLHE